MSDATATEETKIPVTGGEEGKTYSQAVTGETKIPVEEDSTSLKTPKEPKATTPHPREEEDNSIPVTIHPQEEKKKQPKQPSKKQKAEAIKQQANKEFGAKRYTAAIQLYNNALELDPSNHLLYSNRAAARYNLAQEIAKKGEHPEAKDHCTIHSESETWGAAMSLYYGALEDGLKAIEIEPNFLKAYLRVGACLMALGKYQAAVQSYEATLARFPNEESVKQALREAMEKATKLEEGFPLYHSFINLAGQPGMKPSTPQPNQTPTNPAAAAAAARLHRELFGKRNALIQTPKPETRWKFYFDQPPNPRSAASWQSPPKYPEAEEDDGEQFYQYYQQQAEDEEEEPQQHFHYHHRPSPSQTRFQQQQQQQQQQARYKPFQQQQQPRYQTQQPSYSPHSFHHQQPYRGQQQHQQQQQQQHYQQPQFQSKKRSENTNVPNRKATNGYLQELCENLRVSQYLPALLEQGVETVDDLMLLSPEAIQSIFPTLGHQARVLDWLRKAKGEI